MAEMARGDLPESLSGTAADPAVRCRSLARRGSGATPRGPPSARAWPCEERQASSGRRCSATIRGRDWPGRCTLCQSSTSACQERVDRMATHALRYSAAAASVLAFLSFTGPVRADVVTFPPQHVRLGFQASFPLSDMKSDSVTCVSYSASFTGTATFAVDLGADLTLSYDRADIVPGGAVPLQVTYTPTNDATHEVTLHAAADVSLS